MGSEQRKEKLAMKIREQRAEIERLMKMNAMLGQQREHYRAALERVAKVTPNECDSCISWRPKESWCHQCVANDALIAPPQIVAEPQYAIAGNPPTGFRPA